MSALQKQAVQMILSMSDESRILQVVQFIHKIEAEQSSLEQAKQKRRNQAFHYLERVWDDIKQYYPDGFDEEREYEEAMRERYGIIDTGDVMDFITTLRGCLLWQAKTN